MTNRPVKVTTHFPNKNGVVFTPQAKQQMVEQVNERAATGSLLGHLEAPFDNRTSLTGVTHRVLPGAKLNEEGSLTISIEVLDTDQGRYLRSLLDFSPSQVAFSLRVFGSYPDYIITGVDVSAPDLRDWTVLDGICDAMDREPKI